MSVILDLVTDRHDPVAQTLLLVGLGGTQKDLGSLVCVCGLSSSGW